VLTAVQGAAAGLEGKILEQDEQSVRIQFHKTIHGQVLGDRTVFETTLHDADGGTRLAVEAYPVDAIGKKLQFGARKGVTRTVMGWFWAHIDHQLSKES
jgi:hypothetical protein